MGDAVDVQAARGDVGGDQDAGRAALEISSARSRAFCDCCRGWPRRRWRPGRAAGDAVGAMLGAGEDQRAGDRRDLRGDATSSAGLSRAWRRSRATGRRFGRGRDGATSTRTGSGGCRRRGCGSPWAWSPRRTASAACAGARAMILRMSWMKPMSSMRSASSRTKISIADEAAHSRWPMRSSRRPGVATSMSTPRRSAWTCGCWPTPPKIDRAARRAVAAVGAEALVDLRRELARGGQDQDADRPRVRRCRGAGEALEDGQGEGGGLAGAGLGAGEQVAAGEQAGGMARTGWAWGWCSPRRAMRAAGARRGRGSKMAWKSGGWRVDGREATDWRPCP